MDDGFPTRRPVHGDRVEITADDTRMVLTGPATVRGVSEDGQGYAQLVLDDADPGERRTLSQSKRVQFTLYRNDQPAYVSPPLQIERVWRLEDARGALAVLARP